MRYKLTLRNIQILEKLNSNGQFIRTPEPSEVEEIEKDLTSMYHMCNWLLWASINNKVSNKRYIEMATYFDTLPLVGEYFRKIVSKDYSI